MRSTDNNYDIETGDIMHEKGEAFDILAIAREQTPWWNRTLCAVNNAWVRLGVMEGDFHWHKHDKEDEFFFVLEGQLDIELEERMITLSAGQAFTVPVGTMHCPHSRGRSVVLMIEQAGVVPTGN